MPEPESYPPSAIMRMIANFSDPTTGELRPNVHALAVARKQNWTRAERDQYIRLCVLLGRDDAALPEDVVDVLVREFSATRITDRLEPVLLTVLSVMKRIPRDYPCTDALVKTFNRWTIEPDTCWQARLYAPAFLNRLSHVESALHQAFRRHMSRAIIEWSLDYHTTYAIEGFELRSRAIFSALLGTAWADERMQNVRTGLDGAFNCCVAKLMEAAELDWFNRFIEDLASRVLEARMFRRLAAQTLHDVAQDVARARRKLGRHKPETVLALDAFEEAVHRPHRRLLERAGVPPMEVELPGVRGFDGRTRFRLHDLSTDGCLAWLGDDAYFRETDHAVPVELDRRFNRTFTTWQHRGVIRAGGTEIQVRPGNELLLHDGSGEDIPIDRASIVRYSRDPSTGRLWLGFHFDEVLPRVQRKIDELVASET